MSRSYTTQLLTPVTGEMYEGLNDVFAYWDRLRGRRAMPAWPDFDWMRLPPPVIPWCAVVDVRQDPLDFVYRFWGTARTAFQGHDYTGWSIGDVSPKSVSEKILSEYRMIYEERRPVYFETVFEEDTSDATFKYHFLRLPFGQDGERVAQILGVGLFEEKEIRKVHDFFETVR